MISICDDAVTQPGYCAELDTVPAGIVAFVANDAVRAYDADVLDNALNCVELEITPLNLF